MNYVLFVVIHGVQLRAIRDNYADKLIEGVRSNFPIEHRGYFVPLVYNWSGITHERQLEMYRAVESGLPWYARKPLRKLKHTVGSDVVWSGRAKEGTKCFYSQFLADLSQKLEEQVQRYRNPRIVFFGHSQGSQNALCFIWDYGRIVSAFFSAGSPISMASGMFDDWGRAPANLQRWVNFWNPMDWISSPLGSHPSKEIRALVNDARVPLGPNPLNWTTAGAHGIYWRSPFVHKRVAEEIKRLVG